MPTIVFASSKGGCGKTVSAVLLASELAHSGTTVTLIDADPNQPIVRWAAKPGVPAGMTVISSVSETTLLDDIDAARRSAAFVVVDLEGTANLMVAQAMSRADLVIIPLQGAELDAVESIKVIEFLKRQERAYGRVIRYSLLFTKTSPAVRSRTLKSIEREFYDGGIPMFGTPLHERDAFRAVFNFGATLYELDQKLVGGIQQAIENVQQFASEVVEMLTPESAAA